MKYFIEVLKECECQSVYNDLSCEICKDTGIIKVIVPLYELNRLMMKAIIEENK